MFQLLLELFLLPSYRVHHFAFYIWFSPACITLKSHFSQLFNLIKERKTNKPYFKILNSIYPTKLWRQQYL